MKAKFTGKPLIEITRDIPQIGFLEGDFGKEVLAEYNKIVESKYKNNKNLRVLSESNNLVQGSNPLAVVLVNQILTKENLRTANQADLEKALKLEALNLSGTYEDTGLVLRSEAEPNSYLAGNLSEQLKARNKKINYPVIVNLTDLELRTDQNSNYGLVFKLREEANPIYAPILNKPGNFSSSDIDESTGLPKKTGSGNRNLYTRDSGLSGLYLNRVLSLFSGNDALDYSNSDGRVVVVSGAATAKNSK